MEVNFLILLQLFLAHLLTDFVLQPTRWIQHKRKHRGKSYYLIIHALIAGMLTYLFLQELKWWYVAFFISITHYLIDLWKVNKLNDNLKYFLLDQLFHLIIILVAWLYLIQGFGMVLPALSWLINSPSFLLIAGAYLIVIFPVGFLIGKATKRWHTQIEPSNQKNSLEAAGRYIGIFERILVLTFILTSNFSAIGFLIAAKSILRFSDKSETGARKQTEYVLIGTLMSFAITIILGLLVRHFIFQ
ncbi:DUF3307 domain-containing protein [Gillisia limnaea]|uniref:DUF3307 domain-containing protein n=1 Tax=Gillisia limnaea (strain DSM 15749 / LMG 21470 / R-8282) TaxID=865937 RepID=H2BQR7_GILLR|nr:DUF3307 domain-containing protein [Gillisia limnaea]EHQ04236.1 hypothetical protein Gilli_0078 [Gillisia limnaea DSM 15749]